MTVFRFQEKINNPQTTENMSNFQGNDLFFDGCFGRVTQLSEMSASRYFRKVREGL